MACTKQCLHRMNGKVGTLKARSLRKVVYDTEVGWVIQFDFLNIGTGGGMGDNDIGDKASKYLLILVKEMKAARGWGRR